MPYDLCGQRINEYEVMSIGLCIKSLSAAQLLFFICFLKVCAQSNAHNFVLVDALAIQIIGHGELTYFHDV